MSDLAIYGIGFIAQLLFGSRMIIHWIQSEKAGRVVSPTLFWKASLFASALFLVYGLLRQDVVIIIGQLLGYFIYIRNLQLNGEWQKMFSLVRWSFMSLPVFIFLLIFETPFSSLEIIWTSYQIQQPLVIMGTVGQLLLNFRFIYQWYFAEKTGESILPLGFWVISSFGSVLVILYAIFRLDPVLLVAQLMGIVIYTRSIVLYKRSNSKTYVS
jgi:lipid-A-disaccharide synthase-like uncharacterized protein